MSQKKCSFSSVEAKIHSQCVVFPQVMVHITDENDCSPEFQRSIYSRDNVPETIPIGTSLLQGGDHPFISVLPQTCWFVAFPCCGHEEVLSSTGTAFVKCGWQLSWRSVDDI